MNRYLQYKHIELPWLSEIPAHWDIVRNKNVFSEVIRRRIRFYL